MSDETLTGAIAEIEQDLEVLLLTRGSHRRGLAMCLTKLQEARLWAIYDGLEDGTHVLIDRRTLPTPDRHPLLRKDKDEASENGHVPASG